MKTKSPGKLLGCQILVDHVHSYNVMNYTCVTDACVNLRKADFLHPLKSLVLN